MYTTRMKATKVSGGTAHRLPTDLRTAILAKPKVHALWEDITPLARNEFICWVENAKQVDTRQRRVRRTCEELLEGKRRPCCWVGCIHRKDKAMSATQKWVLGKQGGKA
jgi:uncharacterized protein YdeI (YjbR/CyaY-like superfamily)